jgi:hypothetical protein
LFNPFPERRRSEKLLKFAFPLEMTYFIRDREERKLCLGTDSITLLDFQARLLDGKHFPSPPYIGQQMTFVADRPQKKNPGSARGIDLI